MIKVNDFVNTWIDEVGAKHSAYKKKLLSAPNLERYKIKRGTEIVCDNAFCHYYSLKSVTIPETVIEIGDYSFSGCRSFINMQKLSQIAIIGENAFHRFLSHIQTDNVLKEYVKFLR